MTTWQKDNMTKKQNDKKTRRQGGEKKNDKQTNRQKTKDKRQIQIREFDTGQFRTLAIFFSTILTIFTVDQLTRSG